MIKAITVILLIASFFYPVQASWVFVSFFVILEGYLLIASSRKPQDSLMSNLTFDEAEQQIINRYRLYFRYPYTAKSLSVSMSFIALSTILFVPWLFYNHLWLQASITGLNFFVAQFISSKLNIRFYLHDAVERLKQERFKKEMMLVDSICNKLSDAEYSK